MNRTKLLLLSAFSCFFLCTGLLAQRNNVSAGGNASGTGGSISFSIGQIDYSNTKGTGGTITEGVQQPLEILVTTGVEVTAIQLIAQVYPNPTTDFVVLRINNENLKHLHYALYSVQGALIFKDFINSDQTQIELKGLSQGAYFIQVSNRNSVLKTF